MADALFGSDPSLFSDVPGFEFLGLMSPKRKSFIEAEAARSLGVVGDVFEGTQAQIAGLESVARTPGELQQVNGLSSRLGVLGKMVASGNPKLAQLGMAEFQKLNDDIDRLGTELTGNGIARIQADQDADRDAVVASMGLNERMFKELEPIQVALDAFRSIDAVTQIDSPFALTAAAYRTVMLLQEGTGSRISDADLAAASRGISSWAGWVEQQLAAGAGGEGFTAEARNGLLEVLQPLAQIAEEKAAQTIGRYGALTEASGLRSDIVMAGLDESRYQAVKPQYSEEGTPAAEAPSVLAGSARVEPGPIARAAGTIAQGASRFTSDVRRILEGTELRATPDGRLFEVSGDKVTEVGRDTLFEGQDGGTYQLVLNEDGTASWRLVREPGALGPLSDPVPTLDELQRRARPQPKRGVIQR